MLGFGGGSRAGVVSHQWYWQLRLGHSCRLADGLLAWIASGCTEAAVRANLNAHQAGRDWLGFELAQERYRGLSDREDHLHAARFRATLQPG